MGKLFLTEVAVLADLTDSFAQRATPAQEVWRRLLHLANGCRLMTLKPRALSSVLRYLEPEDNTFMTSI